MYTDVAYEMHVTLSSSSTLNNNEKNGINSGISSGSSPGSGTGSGPGSSNYSGVGHDFFLDIELKDMPSSARSSFANSHSTGMLCRQASFLVGQKDGNATGLRILVVDDSILVLKVVSRLIQGKIK